MGNALGGKKNAKVMKIDGETIKFKIPIKVGDIVKDYPGHVVLESKAVKQLGVRAKPLDPFSSLEPKKLYFLVELPKFSQSHQHRAPRRVRSAIQMSAKDRLENLLLSKRSVSDLSVMGPATRIEVDEVHNSSETGGLRVKMRLPKAEVEKLMYQNRDREEMVEKIMNICSPKTSQDGSNPNDVSLTGNEKGSLKGKEVAYGNNFFDLSQTRIKAGYKKRVGFFAYP